MLEPWVYPALSGVAVVSGFIDAIAGTGSRGTCATFGFTALPCAITMSAPPQSALSFPGPSPLSTVASTSRFTPFKSTEISFGASPPRSTPRPRPGRSRFEL